jgi:hypothetical protein
MGSPIIFLHVQKTGGSTIRGILRREYGQDVIAGIPGVFNHELLQETIEQRKSEYDAIDVLSGHMVFGAHRHLPPGYTYITFLRDPVDRVISDYYYVLRTPSHDYHEPVATDGYSLSEYVESGITFYTNNLHARLISGEGEHVPFGECTPAMADKAIRNLEEHPSVVGLTEHFDKSIILMKQRLGWSLPFYRVQNSTSNRPQKDEVSESDRALIQEYNAIDQSLYEYARECFEGSWSDAPASCHRDLARLHRLNWMFGPVERAYIALRRTTNAVVGRDIV